MFLITRMLLSVRKSTQLNYNVCYYNSDDKKICHHITEHQTVNTFFYQNLVYKILSFKFIDHIETLEKQRVLFITHRFKRKVCLNIILAPINSSLKMYNLH